MEKPVCISYIRFSSSSQADGASYDRQLDAAQEYANKHGMVLDSKYRYEDLGVSAYTGKHAKSGHLRTFLDCVERGDIPSGSVLLIEHIDRLSRENPVDAFEIFNSIVKKDIKIVTLMDGVEYTKDSLAADFGKLLFMMFSMHKAHSEINDRKSRILNGFAKKRANLQNKKFTANCPTWLRLDKDDPNRNTFIILPERIEIVKRIFQMSYDGMGIKAITRVLNQEKVPAPRNPNWYQSSIRKLLSSRSVIGDFQPHIYEPATKKYLPEGDVVHGYFPQIIDNDMFYAVQARISNGSHVAGRKAKVENLFSGRTLCGYCGARMDIITKHNKREITRYLVCDHARRGVQCSYISIKCNEVERAFLTYCKEPDILNVLRREKDADQSKLEKLTKQATAKQGEMLDLGRQIALLENELPTIADQLELGFFRKRLSALLHKQAEIQKLIDDYQREINDLTASMREASTKVDDILALVDQYDESMSEEERILHRTRLQNEIRQIVKQVRVYPRGNIASDEQIEEARNRFEAEISTSEGNKREMLIFERDHVIDQMINSQQNTKDNRYFTVLFNNGNSRHIKYSKDKGAYKVTFERIGDRLDWSMGGKDMPSIILDAD